ncbi:MAG: hypothetical protein AAF741_18185 [Bacteroidota bacterium]
MMFLAVVLMLLASLVWYAKSKYFPKRLHEHFTPLRQNHKRSIFGGYLLSLAALAIIVFDWGFITGFCIWGVLQTTILSAMLISFPIFFTE